MNSNVELSLVVIRSQSIDATVQFYERIGLEFDRERHGTGPEHYAAQVGATVFEIYPESKAVVNGVRLGFRVQSVDAIVEKVATFGDVVITSPSDSPWGRRAVVSDPNGNRVELLQQLEQSSP